MSNVMFGLSALLQVNECLSTSMKICIFKVSRNGSLSTTVHIKDWKTIDSSKDPTAANSAAFSCNCLQYKKCREPKSLTADRDSYLITAYSCPLPGGRVPEI